MMQTRLYSLFSGFKRTVPELTIFHNPSSPPSKAALKLLQDAVSRPYPPTSSKHEPLHFDLQVVEGPPTQDQLRSILSYVAPEGRTAAGSVFLSAHPAAEPEKPADVEAIPKLASQNPSALKWPIVVDWAGGRASVGNVDGVKAMLEELRKVRDGEAPPPEEYKPKGWFS
ncbi:thioredoxin-like protein [Schizophyllum commune]